MTNPTSKHPVPPLPASEPEPTPEPAPLQFFTCGELEPWFDRADSEGEEYAEAARKD